MKLGAPVGTRAYLIFAPTQQRGRRTAIRPGQDHASRWVRVPSAFHRKPRRGLAHGSTREPLGRVFGTERLETRPNPARLGRAWGPVTFLAPIAQKLKSQPRAQVVGVLVAEDVRCKLTSNLINAHGDQAAGEELPAATSEVRWLHPFLRTRHRAAHDRAAVAGGLRSSWDDLCVVRIRVGDTLEAVIVQGTVEIQRRAPKQFETLAVTGRAC
jgi:hypothetical protein